MADLHLGSLPGMFFYSWVPNMSRKEKNEHVPNPELPGSCFDQYAARMAHSSGMPPKVVPGRGAPCNLAGLATPTVDRDCSAGHCLLACSGDIWGTFPVAAEGLQSGVYSSPTSKDHWLLVVIERAVVALVQLKRVVLCCCRTGVPYKVVSSMLICCSERLKLMQPALALFCVLPRNVWKFRHQVKHPDTGTRCEILLEFMAVYRLIGLPLHLLRAHLSLRKTGIPGHTQDFTFFYHMDRTVYTITACSCGQTYCRSRDLDTEDTARNKGISECYSPY